MKGRPVSLSQREVVLAAITLVVVLGVPAYRVALLPAYDRWQSARQTLRLRRIEYGRLSGYLRQRARVEQRMALLGPDAMQSGTDSSTMSRFVRPLEAAASRHRLQLSVSPLPRIVEPSHKIYRVRLVVKGTLVDVVRFVGMVTDQNATVGLDAFTLRGVQGGHSVECGLLLRMVKLLAADGSPVPGAASPTEARAAAGGTHGQ